jgi:excisionase family DNA binding protein
MNEGSFLTVEEVAQRVRTTPETVRRWLRAGRLRGVRPGGDRLGWRVAEGELRRFLAGPEPVDGEGSAEP